VGPEDPPGNPGSRDHASTPKRNLSAPPPPHLPRIAVIVEIEDKTCSCCGGGPHVIGEDRAKMLDTSRPGNSRAVPRLPGLWRSGCSVPRVGASWPTDRFAWHRSAPRPDRRSRGHRSAIGPCFGQQIQ
jgi:hypothetical protein